MIEYILMSFSEELEKIAVARQVAAISSGLHMYHKAEDAEVRTKKLKEDKVRYRLKIPLAYKEEEY